jgi:hypothetical protein
MINTKAVLINQLSSSGALTKIIEFLIAGIPVICNSSSARSYYDFNGIVTFDNFNELNNVLCAPLNIPILPKFPIHDYIKVLKILKL